MRLIIPILINCILVLAVYLADKYTFAKKLPYMTKQIIIGILFGGVSAFASSYGVEWLGAVVNVRDEKSEDKKLSRWRKIAAESVKQCKRGVIPEVSEVMTFEKAVDFSKSLDLVIAPYENEKTLSLSSVLKSEKPKSVGIFIGPEGGIADEEIEILEKAGIKTVTLGKRILRTETAGMAALTAVMYEYGELN